MSDGDALLRAILDDPEDDAPRLVYADWLEERGDMARAAFIRAQIQLTRLPPDDPDRDRLVQTERTLWNANRHTWGSWIPPWAKYERFRRGFLEKIQCDAADFLSRTDDVRHKTPLLAVQLEGAGELVVPVSRSRILEGLRALTLSVSRVPQGTWQHLTECAYLTSLTELDFTSNAFAEELIGALIASEAFPSLQTLRLKWMAIGDEQMVRLVGSKWARRLRALDLGNNHITPAGAKALTESTCLDDIQYLNLRGNPLSDHRPTVDALRRRFGARAWV